MIYSRNEENGLGPVGLALLLAALPSLAQVFTGTITGVVPDPSGATAQTPPPAEERFSLNSERGQARLTFIDGTPASAVDWGGLIAHQAISLTRRR